ncbi:MAG: hypothetical protein F6J90_26430 [Moorea sp. SIOASIH]|uniref:hypothetical protein n=1 Tax=Moorena sp. SIOASIH TaxID=2607817 RepID=UPI0013B6BDCF|nr:hypothetical protein [Moorena sp. SIOASIH]NEO39674.1 hypothetical protein [Moorena sp. SIOASIH]
MRSGHAAIGVKPATQLSGRSWHPDQEFLKSLSFGMLRVKGRPMKVLMQSERGKSLSKTRIQSCSHPKERTEMDNPVYH